VANGHYISDNSDNSWLKFFVTILAARECSPCFIAFKAPRAIPFLSLVRLIALTVANGELARLDVAAILESSHWPSCASNSSF
jgi:hypothetical protein